MLRLLTRIAVAIPFALGTVAAIADVTPIMAVPPAEYRPQVTQKSAPASLLRAADAPAARIVLAAPTLTERASLKALNASARSDAKAAARAGKGGPLAVGFGRAVPAGARTLALDALDWQLQPDGGRVAHVVVQSAGAAALRVALALPPVDAGVAVRFASADGTKVNGPVAAADIATDSAQHGAVRCALHTVSDIAAARFKVWPDQVGVLAVLAHEERVRVTQMSWTGWPSRRARRSYFVTGRCTVAGSRGCTSRPGSAPNTETICSA